MGSLSIIGGSAASGGTEPVQPPAATAENVAAGGSLSPKTFGAFTDPDSVIASYSATATNTSGSTTWSGTGLGAYTPSGAADGSSGVLRLDALDADGDIVATAVHAYSIDAAAGAASWVVVHDLDLTTVTDTADLTSGTTTLTVGSDSIDVTVARVGSTNGFVRGVNGTGVLVDDNNNSNSINAGFDIGGLFAAWGIDELTNGAFAVEVTLEQIDIDDNAGDGWIGVLNSTVSHNSGNSRGMRVQSLSGLTTESVSSRLGGADTQRIASQAISTEVVLTLTTWKGNAVDGQYTVGTTAPTPFTGTVYSSGTKSLGANDPAPYASDLYLVLNATLGASFYVTRLRVLQWS